MINRGTIVFRRAEWEAFRDEIVKLAAAPARKVLEHIPVMSSNVKSVGYDKPSKTLEVAFHGSGLYSYSNVPAPIFRRFMRAKSKGKAFNRLIRKGGYAYEKIE